MSLWQRFLAWLGFGGDPVLSPPVVAVRPRIGIVCHRLNDDDVAVLAAMRVRTVRLSLYENVAGAEWLDRAVTEGFDILCATYRSAADRPADAARWPTVRWQVGNEPDWATIPPASIVSDGAVSCGLASGTPAAWIEAFANAEPTGQILALHAYGTPLKDAVTTTISRIPNRRPCWLTEIGCHDVQELSDALNAIDGAVVDRVYVYALWSESDHYTLTSAQQSVIRQYVSSSSLS